MTERQHHARVALRRAIAVSGAESGEARQAAIEFCAAHYVNPYLRYAIWPKIDYKPDFDKLADFDVYSEMAWQRTIKKFVADPSQ